MKMKAIVFLVWITVVAKSKFAQFTIKIAFTCSVCTQRLQGKINGYQ